jgi:hypothetical protein
LKITLRRHTRWLTSVAAVGSLAMLIGCSQTPSANKSGSTGAGGNTTASGGSAVEKGKSVYASFRMPTWIVWSPIWAA